MSRRIFDGIISAVKFRRETTKPSWREEASRLGLEKKPQIEFHEDLDSATFVFNGLYVSIDMNRYDQEYVDLLTGEKLTLNSQDYSGRVDFMPRETTSFVAKNWSDALIRGIVGLKEFIRVLDNPRTRDEKKLAQMRPNIFMAIPIYV